MQSIGGESVGLGVYEGKVALVVNLASECGLTPQYEGLQALYDEYADQGLVVLGFPCNQFGSQEPGTDAEIEAFACERFDVTFPMFSKIDVNGPDAAPLYVWLKAEQPGDGDSADVAWNFEKFLVDRHGHPIARFSPMVTPEQLAEKMPQLLAQ
jgi:glutathione peroxidase